MQNKAVKRICYIILVLMCSFALCSCSNKEFQEKLIYKLMEEKLEDKTIYDYEELTTDELKMLADQMCDDYNHGLVGYEETVMPLKDVQSLTASDTKKGVIISEAVEWVENMKLSKDHYKNGLDKMASGSIEDYLEAFQQFEQVNEEDENYNDAERKALEARELYYDGMTEKAESYFDDGKYLDAIDIYEELQELYDDKNLDAKIYETEDAYKRDSEEQAKAFIDEKDYINGINQYKELSKYFGPEEYDAVIEDLEMEYIEYAIASSEELLSQGDIDGAGSIIIGAESYLGKKDDLSLQLQRINSFIPVKLDELEPFYVEESSRCYVSEWTASDVDNMGNSGMTGMKVYNYAEHHDTVAGYQYALDGAYDRLTGKFVLHEDSKNLSYNEEDGSGSGAVLRIYGDNELIYQSDVMSGGIKPIDVDVEISGVDKLAVYIVTQVPMIPVISTITVGFVNSELSKTYTSEE